MVHRRAPITRNFVTVDQKQKDPSPVIARFFKFMFGEDYEKVLFLPPKFARKVNHLANQETQIEDISRQRWSVTFSYVDGSLAFKKGWHKFFVDHDLEKGHLLVFNYKGSHFVVEIFGKSACERVNFNNGRAGLQNKRPRREPEIVPQDELFQTNADVNSREKQSSETSVVFGTEFRNCQSHPPVAENADVVNLQVVPIDINMEDPICCLITRDDGHYRGEDRNFLYDLSSFEMEKKPSDDYKSLATSTAVPLTEITEPTDKFEKALQTNRTPSNTEITKQAKKPKGDDTKIAVIHRSQINDNSSDIFSDKGHSKPCDNRNLRKDMSDYVFKFQNGNKSFLASDWESHSVGSSKIAERKHAVIRRCHESSVSSSVPKNPFGKEPTLVRKPSQMLSPVVKVEPDMSYSVVPMVAPFSAQVKTQSYLELPVHIPSIPGKRERGRGKVVYLRDPTGRLWPVLYPDIFYGRALTGNWTKFCEKNNIKPGYECRFQIENNMWGMYRVDVEHMFG